MFKFISLLLSASQLSFLFAVVVGGVLITFNHVEQRICKHTSIHGSERMTTLDRNREVA